jgi:uncharacterized protein YpmS
VFLQPHDGGVWALFFFVVISLGVVVIIVVVVIVVIINAKKPHPRRHPSLLTDSLLFL